MVMAVRYSLVFENQSNVTGNFCVLQTHRSTARPVVWFSKPAAPQTKIVFVWQVSYAFVWADTGPLHDGAMFLPVQQTPAEPAAKNQITLKANGADAFAFADARAGGTAGSLYIDESEDLPYERLAIGISMNGYPVLAAQVVPGSYFAVELSSPVYRVAFGNWPRGEVLDADAARWFVPVPYPQGVDSITAIYLSDGRWLIEPTTASRKDTTNAS